MAVSGLVAGGPPAAAAGAGNRLPAAPSTAKAATSTRSGLAGTTGTDPPLGHPVDTITTCGTQPGIETGGGCLAAPQPLGSDNLQLVDLARTDLTVVRTNTVIAFATNPNTAPLSQAYGQVAANDLVILSSPGLAFVDPQDQGQLAALGVTDPRLPFSVVAVKGQESGAYVNDGQSIGRPGQANQAPGEMRGYFQLDPVGNYNFVFPDYVAFSTHNQTDPPGTNTVTVNGTAYPTPSPVPTGQSGFQLVVLNAATLQLVHNDTIVTNNRVDDGTEQQNGFATMSSHIGDGTVFFLESIGRPQPVDPSWGNFATFLANEGGTAALFNALNDPYAPGIESPTTYAFAGSYLPGPSPGRSTSSEASVAPNGGSATVKGQLARVRTAMFAPYMADNTNTLDQGLFQTAYQNPTPFPYASGSGAQAVSDIDVALRAADTTFPATTDLRSEYWQDIGDSGWDGDFQGDLRTLTYPLQNDMSPSYSQAEFTVVTQELLSEFNNVRTVSDALVSPSTGLGRVLAFASTNNSDLTNIADTILGSLPGGSGPNGTLHAVQDGLYITSDVLGASGSAIGLAAVGLGIATAASGGVAIPLIIGAVAAGIAIAAIFTTDGGNSPSPFIQPVQVQANQLGTNLSNEYHNAVLGMEQIGEMLTSDYGKLTAGAAQLAPVNLALNNAQGLGAATAAYDQGARQALWNALLPVAYQRYTAIPAVDSILGCDNRIELVNDGLVRQPVNIPGNAYYVISGFAPGDTVGENVSAYLLNSGGLPAPPTAALLQALYSPADVDVNTPGGALAGAGLDPVTFLSHYSAMTPVTGYNFRPTVACSSQTVAPTGPYQLLPYRGSGQSAATGAPFASPLAARVTDVFGIPQANGSVSFTAPQQSGASLTFAPGGTTTSSASADLEGVATSPAATANTIPGAYNVTSQFAGTSAQTQFTLGNGPPLVFATSGSNQYAAVGSTFAAPVVANVTDPLGNPLANQPVTFNAPTSGPTATFPGGGPAATVSTDTNGQATSPPLIAAGAAGNYTVTATLANSTTNTPSFALTNTAAPPVASQVALVAAPAPVAQGQPLTLTATVSSATTGVTTTPTGMVQFSVASDNLGPPVTLVNGVATSVVPPAVTATLPVGPLSFGAAYNGDPVYQPSNGGFLETINPPLPAPTTVAVTTAPDPSASGQNVAVSATVTPSPPGSGTPTGNVQFSVDGTPVGAPVVLSGATAVPPALTGLDVGAHTISAAYSGDTTFARSTGTATQTVHKARTATKLTSSVNPVATGRPVRFAAVVTVTAPGAGTPTGTVQFIVDGVALGAAVHLVRGKATSPPTSALSAGRHVVKAAYSGDEDLAASVSAPLTEAVRPTASGVISGRVTDAQTGAGLAGICVSFSSTRGPRTTDPGTCTDATGHYRMSVSAGRYDVRFLDPDGVFLTQWFKDQPTPARARPVVVRPRLNVMGVSAAMIPLR